MSANQMLSAGREGRHRRRGATSAVGSAFTSGNPKSPVFEFLHSTNRGGCTGADHKVPLGATSAAAADGPTIVRTALELISVISFLLMAPNLLISNNGRKMTNEKKKMSGLDQEHQHNTADANNAVTYVHAPASEDKSDSAGTTLELQPNLRRSADSALKDGIAQNEHHPRSSILLLGLVKDLRDVIGKGGETDESESGSSTGRGKGGGVLASMENLCKLYSGMNSDASDESRGRIGIWITYAQDGHSADAENDDESNGQNLSPLSVDEIRNRLEQSGCSEIILESEGDVAKGSTSMSNDKASGTDGKMSRYELLALLRSHQRRRVIEKLGRDDNRSTGYDVVVNIDFDLLSLPSLDEFVRAVEAVASVEVRGADDDDAAQDHTHSHHSSLVVCANGYETWFSPEHGPKLYYDTLPAIDDKGYWYYQTYSRNPFRVATFGQGRLFQSIKSYSTGGTNTLSNHPLWPMQACFGGVAMYGWNAFSSSQCDYVRSEVSLPLPNNQEKDSSLQEQQLWQFPKKYTFSGTNDGDACEHAVFQLCLAEEYRQRGIKDNVDNSFVVGIQPGLIVSREANLMSTDDARTALKRGIVLGLGLFLIGAKITYDRRKKDKSLSYKK